MQSTEVDKDSAHAPLSQLLPRYHGIGSETAWSEIGGNLSMDNPTGEPPVGHRRTAELPGQ